ncbi:hypothetical protein CAPN001_08080 [Capnocytophaga stomatis]|uniref:outer membrane beta-barrel protein n=1 Tax=Capnocytophaga stomatis TaxID=1848904 RepID=UPI001951B775|nr:outer membrane beta-barrel protein [Capnocytophaga stomatis]GIJ96239.1 hypothetical protein CAPN001_08080 [Capnocytophaga stomatis]
MKKIILLFGLFVSFTATIYAQGSLEVGNYQLNGGFGFSGWGIPVYVGVDYGIAEDFTVGGEISFRSHSKNNVKYSGLGIMANGNYHFNRVLRIPSEFDVYAGATVGYFHWSHNSNYPLVESHHSSGLGWGLQVGGRYFFNDNFGVNLELGGGNTAAGKIGITYIF